MCRRVFAPLLTPYVHNKPDRITHVVRVHPFRLVTHGIYELHGKRTVSFIHYSLFENNCLWQCIRLLTDFYKTLNPKAFSQTKFCEYTLFIKCFGVSILKK